MAKQQSDDLRRWAVVGAQARLEEMERERAAIFRAFPELRARRVSFGVPKGAVHIAGQPRKRKMSAAGRKAISEAAKRRWAKVRAEKRDGQAGKKR
jgi:hypothetical protein